MIIILQVGNIRQLAVRDYKRRHGIAPPLSQAQPSLLGPKQSKLDSSTLHHIVFHLEEKGGKLESFITVNL